MRYAVTTRLVQEVTIMVEAEGQDQAKRAAEAVALGFRNAIGAMAMRAEPATTETLKEARRG